MYNSLHLAIPDHYKRAIFIHPFSFSADRVSETITAFDEFPNSIINLIFHRLRTLALCGVRKCFCYSSLLNATMPLFVYIKICINNCTIPHFKG